MKKYGWLIVLCAMVLMVGGFCYASDYNARHSLQEQQKLLEDAIYRALVTCYAVEGRYPSSLSYLEENYNIQVDAEQFRVTYSGFADNILPTVRVMALEGDGV